MMEEIFEPNLFNWWKTQKKISHIKSKKKIRKTTKTRKTRKTKQNTKTK